MDDSARRALRAIPSVSDLANHPDLVDVSASLVPEVVTAVIRRQQQAVRELVLAGDSVAVDQLVPGIVHELRNVAGEATNLVVNGTGVVIHTNLGRSPVSIATAAAMAEHASRYQALEVDLPSGERGGRGNEISDLMRALTGAELTLVVNNNAAAVLLTLAATCAGREVIVSRGEAVEIGGGFRVPDVLRQSGAVLVEVGTTNRTYPADYTEATSANTAAFLKVHASNFALLGFTASATVSELAPLAAERQVLLLEDVGSGCLLDTERFGLRHEPTLMESISAGVDVVCASGDKLLGGPQAGIILGKAEIVRRIAKHPLARALRADKSCLAGLAATLRHYARGEAEDKVPVWWSISCDEAWLKQRAAGWKRELGCQELDVAATESVVGGGSLPGMTLPSWALTIQSPTLAADDIARRLRTGGPALFPRVLEDRVAIDARTVLPDEDDRVIAAVRAALS